MNRKVAALLAVALVGLLGSTAKAEDACSKERVNVANKESDARTACGFMCASAQQKKAEADAKVALAKAKQELAACEKQVQEEVEHKKIAATCTGDQKYNRVTRRCELHCPEGQAMTLDGKCIELKPAAPAPDLAPASAEPAATPSSTEPAQASPPSTAGQRKVTYTVVCMPDVLGEFETKKEAGAKAVEEATATSRTCVVRETIENPRKEEKNNKIVFSYTGKKKEKKQESKAEPPKDDEKKDVVPPGKEAPKNEKKTEESAKPSIEHDPVTEANQGEPLRLEVKYHGFQPTQATLYIRATGDKLFRQVVVKGIKGGGVYWDFKKGDVRGPFEYFITISEGKEIFSAGSSEKPYSVQVTQKDDYKLYCARTTKGPPRSLIKTWPASKKPDKVELDNAGKGLFDCELFQGNDSVTEVDNEKKVATKKGTGSDTDKSKTTTRWIDSYVIDADKAVGGFHGYLVTGLSFTLNGHSSMLYNPVPKVNLGAGLQVLGQYRLSIFAEAGILLPADAWCCNNMEVWWAFGPRIKLSDRWSFATGLKGQHRVATTRFVANDMSRVADLGKTNAYLWRSDLEVRIIKRLSWTLVSFEVGDRGVSGANALVAPTGAIVDLITGLKVHGW